MKTNYANLHFMFLIAPSLKLASITDDELDGYVQDKIDALTGNVNFPTTDPKVTDVQTALDDYRKKLSAAADGDKAATLAKNASRKTLEEQTTLLALDVAKQSKGDLVMFATSHFDARQHRGKTPPLDVPQNFRLIFTKYENQLKAVCNKVNNATSYEFRLTLDPTKPVTDWEEVITTTSSRVEFTELQGGKRYYGKVRAIGGRSKISDWSDQADKICP